MKFNIGDKVKIVREIGNPLWTNEMKTQSLGEIGEVTYAYDDRVYSVSFYNCSAWNYNEQCLELVNNSNGLYIKEHKIIKY